jgi:hypothetical protein
MQKLEPMSQKSRLILISIVMVVAAIARAQKVSITRSPASETVRLPNIKPSTPAASETSASCADIANKVCKDLWDQKHKGTLETRDGKISFGNSAHSETKQAVIEHLQALADSSSRLPADLKAKADPLLADLKKELARERDAKDWYRAISSLETRFQDLVGEVADQRVVNAHPELKNLKVADLTVEQKALYSKSFGGIYDEVLDAQYAKHPNWERVKKLFAEVKADLIAEVKTLPLSEAVKAEHLKTLEGVELTLPYISADKFGSKITCGSTEANAFYSATYRKFTVCAGFFNAIQSEKGLYHIIAHERSPSIDPVSYAGRKALETGSVAHQTQKLAGATKPVYPCGEWKKIHENARKARDKVTTLKVDPLPKLTKCLVPTDGLKPITFETLNPATDQISKSMLSDNATSSAFVLLAQPSSQKDGITIENPFYMRPDRYLAANDGNQFRPTEGRTANMVEIFVQNLSCAEIVMGGKPVAYAALPKGERAKAFEQAIRDTEDFNKALLNEQISFCGRSCSGLEEFGLSANPQENFADWLASRTLSRAAARKDSLEERRDSFAFAGVDFCEPPSAIANAPDLALVEKRFSMESHPDRGQRRLAVFNKRNAELAQCAIDDRQKGFGVCEP